MQVHQTPVMLLTRPAEASRQFADGLTGAEVVIAPLMEIVATGTRIDATGMGGLIVTSKHAVPFLPLAPEAPVYCVGQRTTEAASAHGMQAKFMGQDANTLVQNLLDERPEGPLLHVHGTHTRGDIAQRLTDQGLPTQSAVAYDQKVCAPGAAFQDAIKRSNLIVPLFSPRSAMLFATAAQSIRPDTALLALSPAVADALPPPLRAQTRIAKAPTGGDMRAMLAQLGVKRNSP